MTKLFLDANILVSAALSQEGRIATLWNLSGVLLCTSDYAVEEARRNLTTESHRARLQSLLTHLEVVLGRAPWPADIDLNGKDRPILPAAIFARAAVLLTGDIKDFGHLFGRTIEGVLVLWPGEYLRRRDLEKSS